MHITVMDFIYLGVIAVAVFLIVVGRNPDLVDPQLYRTNNDRMVAGVFGGLGRWMGVPALWLRLGWIAAFLLLEPFRFQLLIAYGLMWAFTPRSLGP